MFAARRRAGCLARRLQRTTRRYASDGHGHGHDHGHQVNESFGKGSIATVGIFFGGALWYSFGPLPSEDSSITKWLAKFQSRPEDWAEINALHTKAMEQAGFDKNLFENVGNKTKVVHVSFPEAIQSHAPRNVPAGHLRNLDDVVEHYRRLHVEEEEKKAKKLAERQP